MTPASLRSDRHLYGMAIDIPPEHRTDITGIRNRQGNAFVFALAALREPRRRREEIGRAKTAVAPDAGGTPRD